jgi:hypothetical protein
MERRNKDMEKERGPFSVSKRIAVNKPSISINGLPVVDYVVPIYCMKINRKNFCNPVYCVNKGERVSHCTICLDAARALSRAAKKRRTI